MSQPGDPIFLITKLDETQITPEISDLLAVSTNLNIKINRIKFIISNRPTVQNQEGSIFLL